MARVELVMPKMGEAIMEARIISWSKEVGQRVEADETVLEIATDKVDSEVPSPVAGVLVEKLYKPEDVVPVGAVIAYFETENTATSGTSGTNTPAIVAAPVIEPARAEVVSAAALTGASAVVSALMAQPQSGRFYSPLVLNIAREEKIGMDELDRIPGTGAEGRVTKKDILQYVELRKQGGGAVTAVSTATAPAVPVSVPAPAPTYVSTTGSSNGHPTPAPGRKTFVHSGEIEIIEMDRMRKLIAENMLYSKQTSPHVTSFVEADVTHIVQWRDRHKGAFEKKYGEKLTFTPIFIEAVARALRDYPMVNISVDGDKILLKKDINIGLAVALPTGNLIVPVVKKADRLNLAGLASAVNDFTHRARNNKLKPDDLTDGTYTLSNVGTFGNVMGTPIIMQPQVAILATGAIVKKPAVIETPAGDFIGIRHKMFLSHSYDHRVVDGALGGAFVRKVADYLEAFDLERAV
jgi:2-oxoglutarate dehydrogenase E2 component (dihydrolipoamide succinyltransferase)